MAARRHLRSARESAAQSCGATIVRIVSRDGRRLVVSGLDAIDGTPVIDIKPVFQEFLPSGRIVQPAWSRELMRNYWT